MVERHHVDPVVGLNFTKLSPTGNITIIIWDAVPRAQHQTLAKYLLAELHLGAEQVGYYEPATQPGAVARLQMMGGEFCGNATRSFASELVRKKHAGIEWHESYAIVPVEVSGASRVLPVRVELLASGQPGLITVDMPFRPDPSSIQRVQVTVNQKSLPADVVNLDGISHVLLNDESIQFDRRNKQRQQIDATRDILRQCGLLDLEAAGVMYLSKLPDGTTYMEPIVYVRATETLIPETACGSGTVAVGLALAKERGASVELAIAQPSGGTIHTAVSYEHGQFTWATIAGPVAIIAEGVTFVPADLLHQLAVARA